MSKSVLEVISGKLRNFCVEQFGASIARRGVADGLKGLCMDFKIGKSFSL
jgi:hypothetical protein